MKAYRFVRHEIELVNNHHVWTEIHTPRQLEPCSNFTPTEGNQPDDYLQIPNCSGSDYSGGSLEVANFRCVKDEYGSILVEGYGDAGTYDLFVRRDVLASNPDLRDTIDTLERETILSEDEVCEVEREAEQEAWKDWVCNDFQNGVLAGLEDNLTLWDTVNRYNNDETFELFVEAFEASGEEWIHETGNTAYVDLGEVIPAALNILKNK